MGLNIGKIFGDDETVDTSSNDRFYDVTPEDMLEENNGTSRMILLEPRAYSEANSIVNHLKERNTVVVNLKRVTGDQAKRIMDFLSGAIYAIGGKAEKIGGGIFLCTPNNVNVQGEITDDKDTKDVHDNTDLNIEW